MMLLRWICSLLWKNTKVVDWGKTRCKNIDITKLSKKFLGEFVLNRCFRAIFGIPDSCLRNFLFTGEKLYSIDEEGIFNFKIDLSSAYFRDGGVFKNFVENNTQWLDNILDRWHSLMIENKKEKIYKKFY